MKAQTTYMIARRRIADLPRVSALDEYRPDDTGGVSPRLSPSFLLGSPVLAEPLANRRLEAGAA